MSISFVTITGESVTVTVGNRLHREREREREHCLGCAIAASWGGKVVLQANSVASAGSWKEQMRALKLRDLEI